MDASNPNQEWARVILTPTPIDFFLEKQSAGARVRSISFDGALSSRR